MSTNENEQVSLEDLNYFWMENGAPCFMADREDICEVIESLGFQIYYLIADSETEKIVEGKDSQQKPYKYSIFDRKARVLKVVNNIVGRSISETDDEFGPDVLASVQEEAFYNMPKIPQNLTDKLDEFFRLVHAQHGTESIVILTFDPTKEDSSGWGILVPEQTNTSVHCKYDADSIVDLKPDHVIIVGSVHSHPEMAAYASGTDHQDQADFDGIHITYGWQKSVNGGATQYHAEMQLSGTAYKLNIEDVFETNITLKDPDPEVVEWTGKVKKALPPYQPSVTGVQQTQAQSAAQGYTPHTAITGTKPTKAQVIPFNFSQLDGHLIAEIDLNSTSSSECPACQTKIFRYNLTNGYCHACHMLLADSNASLNEIQLTMNNLLVAQDKSTELAYYLWCRDDKNDNFLINLKPDDLDSRPTDYGIRYDMETWEDTTLTSANDYLDRHTAEEEEKEEVLFLYGQDTTLCCAVNSDRAWTECKCPITVYFEDIEVFDEATASLTIYEENSPCQACAFFSSPECSSYRSMVIDYIENKELPKVQLNGCDEWTDYDTLAAKIDSGMYGFNYDYR
jgi:hypothetical protein